MPPATMDISQHGYAGYSSHDDSTTRGSHVEMDDDQNRRMLPQGIITQVERPPANQAQQEETKIAVAGAQSVDLQGESAYTAQPKRRKSRKDRVGKRISKWAKWLRTFVKSEQKTTTSTEVQTTANPDSKAYSSGVRPAMAIPNEESVDLKRPACQSPTMGRRELSVTSNTSTIASVEWEEAGFLLSPRPAKLAKPTLVLDLDETLVHSSFQPDSRADFIITVTLEGVDHQVYVIKRPGVDDFLRKVAEKWEVVLFTASLSVYADPLVEVLDPHGSISACLFREACVEFYGNYVKDLSVLGRPMSRTVFVDNSPNSYQFHPKNAIEISSFYDDKGDRELMKLESLLNDYVYNTRDVRQFLDAPMKRIDQLIADAQANDMQMTQDYYYNTQQSGLAGAVTQVPQHA